MQNKSSLLAARRELLEIFQKINFGRIERLTVRKGEPALNPPPRVVQDLKLGADNTARAERDVADFALKQEHIELFENLTRLGDGTIDSIEIKHGLPFRLTVEQKL